MYENYFMLDGKKIPMSDETRDSLREAQKKPMPKLGQRWWISGNEYVLSNCAYGQIGFINPENGNRWADPVKVGDMNKITYEEFREACSTANHVRFIR